MLNYQRVLKFSAKKKRNFLKQKTAPPHLGAQEIALHGRQLCLGFKWMIRPPQGGQNVQTPKNTMAFPIVWSLKPKASCVPWLES